MLQDDKAPPVKVGDILNLRVEGFGKNNDPILKVDKYVLFLKNVSDKKFALNDPIEIKVTKTLEKFGFAELV